MRVWRITIIASALASISCGTGTDIHVPSGAGTTMDAGGAPGVPSNPGTPAVDSGTSVVGSVGDVKTALPVLPTLDNVTARQSDDSAEITFDPFDGALDYRVYPLPSDGDVTVGQGGQVVVKNAIYRCAGNREAAAPYLDNATMIGGDAIHTQVDNQKVGGYVRTVADATLGYVYTQPGPGRLPVYTLGDSNPSADSTCFFARWAASRVKTYTTSDAERSTLLAAFGRDDGVAFYVPATADATTKTIYVDASQTGLRYYFPDGAEASAHKSKVPSFSVLTAQAPGTQPLMRVWYANECGWSHDELAVGKERFNRIYRQGDAQPWWSLVWSGVTKPTTLVVEALDSGCPYQGHLSPTSLPSVTGMFGTTAIPHEPFVTIADMRGASPTSEVFLNGQRDTKALPKAVARSFVNVVPSPHPAMDFFAGFSADAPAEAFTDIPCGIAGGNCYATYRQTSATFDQMFINAEYGPTKGSGLYAFGPALGQLWVTFADVAADTNGKYRLTPKQKAKMSDSTFLHATMEVDIYSTQRRYPQLLISDQDIPVQYNLEKGHTLVIQPRAGASPLGDWPIALELQICNMRTWDVNNQCPVYELHNLLDASGKASHLAANDEVGELASADKGVVFDVYASTSRAYLMLDGKPFACANLPAGKVPVAGSATVTWGDVLYHSAVDYTFAFHKAHLQVDTRRHFDNLGFSSGVPAPPWDESRFPCAAPISP